MNRFIFLLFMLSLCKMDSYAQSKARFTTIIEGYTLKGNNDHDKAFSFTSGIAYKNVSVGVGIATDNYLFHSIPLVLDVRKYFGQHKLQPFVSTAAGINFQHPTDAQKQFYLWQSDYQFKNGFTFKTMAGGYYKIYKRLHLVASTGYNYKTTKVRYDYPIYMINQKGTTTDIYRMNRWSFSVGIALL